MKVYIITSGSYSDYGINRVFLDKEKAEKYVSMRKGGYDELGIEEWESDDDTDFQEINYVCVSYKVKCLSNTGELTIRFNKTTNVDDQEMYLNGTHYYHSDYSNEDQLSLSRVIAQNHDEEEITAKYKKVCQDLYAQILYQKSQGWDEKMIRDWINGQKELA